MQKNKKQLTALLFLGLAMSFPLQAFETQLLACSYYDTLDASANASLMHAGLPWVWAKGLANENIYVRGQDINGFFEVENLSGREEGYLGSRIVGYYQNDRETARKLCERGLRDAFPDDNNKILIGMMVKTSFLSIHHLIPVFHKISGQQQKINKMVIFGDSLSDQNNLKSWLRVLPGSPYFGGRFTNGPNWVDYLHLESGISVQNWAVGGAVTSINDEIHLGISSRISGSVEAEINRYKETLENRKIINSEQILFVLWEGGNDYLAQLASKNSLNIFIDDPEDPVSGSNKITKVVVNNIVDHMKILYDSGARNFLVVNLPNFGVMPKVLRLVSSYRRKSNIPQDARLIRLSRQLNNITRYHNQELKTHIEDFSQSHPEAKIIYGDIYGGLAYMASSRHMLKPHRHFNYKLDPDFIERLTAGRKPVYIHRACYTGGVCGTDTCAKICDNPNNKLFWDSIHPSSFGHCLVALELHKRLNTNELMSTPDATSYFQRCRPELNLSN